MEVPVLKLKRLDRGEGLPLPQYATDGSAAMDVCAAYSGRIDEYDAMAVPTGFEVEVPEGWELQVRPRSGLALKHGIAVLNSPGTIDSDYRGEIKVILQNMSGDPFDFKRGDRIAQIILKPAPKFIVQEVSELSKTDRGNGGFGSTGI